MNDTKLGGIKISNFQLFALTSNFTIGTTIITLSSIIAGAAKQDAWICALITSVIGLLFVWIYYYLGKLYPGKTLVDIFYSVFGKWIGFIISVFFVVFVSFMDTEQVISYIGNFIQTEYMTETPLYALNLLVVVALVIGLLYGLEAVARSSEIFIYIIVVLIIFTIILNIPNIKPNNLKPVFEGGIAPILKGSLQLSSFMTWPLIILNMVYPVSSDNSKKARNSLFLGFLLAGAVNFLITLMSILVLGSTITARSQYPTYLLAKEIDIGIIDRLEAIISFSWVISVFIRLLLYCYAGVIGLSQILKLKNYKKIVLPLGLVMLVYSGVVYPNSAYREKWDSTTWVPFIMTFGVVFPVIILIVSIIKNKIKDKQI